MNCLSILSNTGDMGGFWAFCDGEEQKGVIL